MEIGFTGTREGMTKDQYKVVQDYMLRHTPDRAHHGDCVGADADFHRICRLAGTKIKGHPPVKEEHRAFSSFDEYEKPKSYYARNRDIVDECEILIATPKEMSEQPNGGTWYTVGYARTVNRKTIIVWPDGSITQTVGNW